jgi:hypothetical protein
MRYLDKLVAELARGKATAKLLRAPQGSRTQALDPEANARW